MRICIITIMNGGQSGRSQLFYLSLSIAFEEAFPNARLRADRKLSPSSIIWTVLDKTRSTLPVRLSALVRITCASSRRVFKYDPAETNLWLWILWLEKRFQSSIIWSLEITPTSVVNIPIYSLSSLLIIVSITFLISFWLLLFKLCYLEAMDIFLHFSHRKRLWSNDRNIGNMFWMH